MAAAYTPPPTMASPRTPKKGLTQRGNKKRFMIDPNHTPTETKPQTAFRT
ncbi:hypothetical protein RBSH_00428 [Rhodopirellula baltica SH28]|uniref:Uncharacterized protein n=1 Tax=Rhodopirellula baltica SH28 TaxID=993517 RepID=K5DP60_RHOBT|nr:hypothetical protein RBSH_00428 [Rhodopirellula baltica SH28]